MRRDWTWSDKTPALAAIALRNSKAVCARGTRNLRKRPLSVRAGDGTSVCSNGAGKLSERAPGLTRNQGEKKTRRREFDKDEHDNNRTRLYRDQWAGPTTGRRLS